MKRYILSRVGEAFLVLLVMSFVIYSLIGLMPGDPIDVMVNSNPGFTAADVEKLRALYGLDQPLLLRYWHWLQSAATLDFGYSRAQTRPVMDIVPPALWHSVKLMGLTFAVTLVLALMFGVLGAIFRGTKLDTAINLVAFAGISIPTFWLALMLIFIFAVWLGWLPASGMQRIGGGGSAIESFRYLLLPVVTLVLNQVGGFTRFTRAAMIEVLSQDYIRTARAKGVGDLRLIRKHALRNAMIPVVTFLAVSFGNLFSGTLIVETMFAQRGIGKLLYESILGNDFNLALVCLLFATLVTLIANLLADIAYAWLDPRISLSKEPTS